MTSDQEQLLKKAHESLRAARVLEGEELITKRAKEAEIFPFCFFNTD